MGRFRNARMIIIGVAVVAAALGLVAGSGTADATAGGFSSSDVGFAEGGTPAGLPTWLDAMDAYVGDKKPIIRLDLDWWYVQPEPTATLHWDQLDPLVDA